MMNRLDWAQVALSLVVMLAGLYIVLLKRSMRGLLATTRVAGFGVALLSLSYFVGGFEGFNVEGPLLDRVEVFSALVGMLVVLGGPDLAGARSEMKVMKSGDLAGASRLPQHLSLRTQESRWQVASSGGALTDALVQKAPVSEATVARPADLRRFQIGA